MFANKEQLLNFMLAPQLNTSCIRLSHYDYKFMANLHQFIKDKQEITSNQAKLFDLLISKYKRQLAMHHLDKEQLKQLPWQTKIVESLPQFTQAHVGYDEANNILTITLPYKKDFINKFRNSYEHNPWEWNKPNRRYEAPVSTYALLVASQTLPKFFPVVYTGKVKPIMDEVDAIAKTAKYWSPTYINVNGSFMVVASNPDLDNAIADLTLDDSPTTLSTLAQMGIDIDESVHNNDEELLFYSQYVASVTVTDLENDIRKLFLWLVNLHVDSINVSRGSWDQNMNKSFIDLANKYNIRHSSSSSQWVFGVETEDTNLVEVYISFSSHYQHPKTNKFSKIINVINQQEVPIE